MVRSFYGFRPSPRFDSIPWDRVRIEEAALQEGPYTEIDEQVLAPPDADPTSPLARNITTDDATLSVGWYVLTFLDASDNEDPAAPIEYPGSGYPSVAELVAESSNEALLAMSYDDQQTLYTSARFSVEAYCGQSFAYFPAQTRMVDGNGQKHLYLPWRLEAITELEVDHSGLTTDDVVLSDEHDALTVPPDAGIRNYYERAMMHIQDYPGMYFSYGIGTVAILGDWGWAEFPEAVADAMRIDMEDQALSDTNSLTDTLRSYRRLGIRDISQGNLSVGFFWGPGGSAVSGSLSDTVTRLLTPYVWQGQIGAIV